MKQTLLLLSLLFICNMFAYAELPSYLVIRCNDGSRVTYLISDEPKMTFDGSNMAITSNDINVEYPLYSVEQITYEKGSETSVENVCEDTILHYIKDNTLNVINDVSDYTINIYDIFGKCVVNKSFHKSETASISLSNFDKGIYILTINKNSFKFRIK